MPIKTPSQSDAQNFGKYLFSANAGENFSVTKTNDEVVWRVKQSREKRAGSVISQQMLLNFYHFIYYFIVSEHHFNAEEFWLHFGCEWKLFKQLRV